MFKKIVSSIVGDPNKKIINNLRPTITAVAQYEPELQQLPDEAFRERTAALKERVAAGEELDDILPEAFALVREASRRAIGLRHYDVQLMGGILLHQGEVVEMRTGEGKTLVATLPLYLNALAGEGVHLVTVNEYLARRDGGWMGKIFHLLGLSVGVIGPQQFSALFDPEYVNPGAELEDERLVHWRPCTRLQAYQADITYGISSEFGFDYLRDNMAIQRNQLVQRNLHFAIIDEVDNILIDEARTPLIISGPAAHSGEDYVRFSEYVQRLRANTAEEDEEANGHYDIDEKSRSINLTEMGIAEIERRIEEIDPDAGDNLYDPRFYHLTYYLDNALRAQYLFKRDVDYVVQGDEVIIVDDFTGRLMPGRRYSEGLHEAIEAKEKVNVKRETVTVATITLQNYFRLYDKLAGMTGTALTDAEEFDKIYELGVTPLPTNVEYILESGQRELETQRDKIDGTESVVYIDKATGKPAFFKRIDFADQVYGTADAKDRAIIAEIKRVNESGRPILVGTTSVEHSETIDKYLSDAKIEHAVLNAKIHQSEALIVAQAGRKGAVTISTNMAGRGTDILLGGNAEGLAANWLNQQMFDLGLLKRLSQLLLNGDEKGARDLVEKHQDKLGEALLDKLASLKESLDAASESIGRIEVIRHVALELQKTIDAEELILLEGEPLSDAESDDEYDDPDEEGMDPDASIEGESGQADKDDASLNNGGEGDAAQALKSEKVDHGEKPAPASEVIDEAAEAGPQNLNVLDAMITLMTYVDRGQYRQARSFVERLRLGGEKGEAAEDLPPVDISLVDEGIRLRARYKNYQMAVSGGKEADFIAELLFEEHYKARAALIRAVLAGDEQETLEQLAGHFPELLEMSPEIGRIQREVHEQRAEVRQMGGLHVIGSERHESRRIDNQLRGRAARQGDPGSSRFFLSLEDDLMRRFGGERLKSIMSRINTPEDIPLEAGMMNRIIESSQQRVEGYNFDMRKNIVEYDDVMSKQREAVYSERRTILMSTEDELDAKVDEAFELAIEELVEHYIDDYPGFIRGEVERVVNDLTTDATNTVNLPAVIRRLEPLLPLMSELDPNDLQRTSPDRLTSKLASLANEQQRQGTNLLQLLHAMNRFLPLMPSTPPLGALASHKSGQLQTRERLRVDFVSQVEKLYEEFLAEYIDQEDRETIWSEAAAAINQAFNQFNLEGLSLKNKDERQKRFRDSVEEVLRSLLLHSLRELNGQQLTDALSKHIDRQQANWRKNIGARDYRNYVRYTLLSAIDGEWRDYLTAMDDLRREIGLQAFGQRDPKIEYKKRSYEMFTEMRQNIQRYISEKFFVRIAEHRQLVLNQRAHQENIRRMEEAGYRRVRREHGKGQELRRELTKIGRNDPCFCGSGRKYKNCHGRAAQATSTGENGKKTPKQKKRAR